MSGLGGRTVVITRAAEDAAALEALVEARGGRAVRFCTIERQLNEPAAAARVWAERARFDRFVIGSAAALEVFRDLEPGPVRVKLACVGAKTAEAVSSDPALDRRFEVAEVATSRRAEGLVAALVAARADERGRLDGRRFLNPRAPEGRSLLVDALGALGAEVVPLETYRIDCASPDPGAAARLEGAWAFTFLSGRTLECFLLRAGEARGRALLAGSTVAVIGPVAEAVADRLGVRVDVVPPTASAEALVEALAARAAAEAVAPPRGR